MNPFVARVAAALAANSGRQPSSVAVAFYDERREYGTGNGPSWPLENNVASRLVTIGATNSSICEATQYRRHPLIVLGHAAQVPGTTSILPDYSAAAHLALGLFAQHGHKRVGVVGGPFANPEPRFSAMIRPIAEAAHAVGLSAESCDLYDGSNPLESEIDALLTMPGHSLVPTALLCLNEAVAIQVLAGARARGLAVPGHLSVIAIADHEGVPPSCVPLTTVVLPADEMTATAVREADRQLRSGIPTDAQEIVVGVKLMERATCGQAKR